MTRAARVRRALAVAAVVAVEVWFWRRYASQGALFHFWLHALLGGWLGLGLLAALRLLRPGRPGRTTPVDAGFAGHLWSAVPDVLFVAVGLLHATWMDVFALHVTAHFLWPDALLVGLVLWSLAVLAVLLVALGRRRAAAGALAASVVALAVAGVLRTPLPTTLQEVRRLEAAAQGGQQGGQQLSGQAEGGQAEGGQGQGGQRQGGPQRLVAWDWVCRVPRA